MKPIPLYKMNEHHEAFLIWHDAIKKNYITPTGNTLLHVDQHDDMSNPVLRTSIHNVKQNKESLHSFTYDELGIGTFIYPAVYTRIFNLVYWILQPDDVTKAKHVEDLVLSTYQSEGKIFLINHHQSSDPRKIAFKRHDITLDDSIEVSQPVVLDIDIDYFSCVPYQNKPIRLEITREQFNKYNNNKYHLLRFEYASFTEQIKDQYFLVLNQSEHVVIRQFASVSKSEIVKRIDWLIDWLQAHKITPLITEICRDTYSGFIPDDQREFTEDYLIEKLETIYEFKPVYFE